MIRQLCKRQDIVFATGGGVISQSKNRETLCSNGTVVYLTAPIKKLFTELGKIKIDHSYKLMILSERSSNFLTLEHIYIKILQILYLIPKGKNRRPSRVRLKN